MATQDVTYRTIEDMLCDKMGEALSLKLHFLRDITNNFSKDNLIGRGGFGEVYKGVLEGGIVAVKKLYSHHTIEEEPFQREVDCLMNIRHHNIVMFVGYCAETQEVVTRQQGKPILAEKREKLLCFEYLPNGSLHNYLTDKPCRLRWQVCYQIIKGMCLGLHYLHGKHIIHLDLKPDNILLDNGMVPKIADFGLSRVLGEDKTRTITQTIQGNRRYMAPEYLDDGEITIKSDIYSLGVVIRQMVMARNTGTMTDQDVLESWVIMLEKDYSLQMRDHAQLEILYKEQIKACIQISQRCTQPKPEDRPSMQDILLTLVQTEARAQSLVGPSPNVGKVELAKFGPWGGYGGKPQDIKMAPYRLENITISSGTIIDSIGFSYIDHDGRNYTIGPWGGHGGDNNSIQLGHSEFLTGVSGTVDPFENILNVITSLMFVTNARSYGPFGKGRGTPFHIQMQNNGWIVGFFGRSSRYLNAIGVYTNQYAGVARIGPSGGDGGVLHDILDHNGQEHSAGPSGECGGSDNKFAKFGPWGGDGGEPQDIKMLPYRLDRVTISSGVIIDSIDFSYIDRDGQYHTTGPWGGHGGDNNSFQLGPSEFLTRVSGSIGSLNSHLNVITSLTFVTNARSYGPYGEGRGKCFHIPMEGNGCIVGFFGRSGRYLNAIGVYTNHELEITGREEAGVARIGPWGGDGRVIPYITEEPHHLQRLTIFSGSIISSLEYLYTDDNGQQHTAGPWGGCGGTGRKARVAPISSEGENGGVHLGTIDQTGLSGGGGDDSDNFEFAKFGPWGGDEGNPRDIKISPYRLHSVTIRSGVIVDSIKFSYTDRDGESHMTGPWGGHGGSDNLIQLGPSEFLTGISGSIGEFNGVLNVITSLTFVTNARSYGPFGTGRGTHFHIPMLSNGCIVGFFGRSDRYLNAIGVYMNHELEIGGQEEGGVTRIGPWGADGGILHDIIGKPHHLERITIFSGIIIDSFEYLYSDNDGNQHIAGPWGGNGGAGRRIHLDPEEFIVKASGTIHPWGDLPNVVYSLTLVTNRGTSYGPFGTELGAAFHIPVQSNSRIVGFFARGKDYIEAIGAYIRTM